VRPPLLQAFPFPSTLGEVALHPPSPASVFIYSSREKWAFPPLLWSFPPTATFTSFPAPGCWGGAATPAFSSRLIYSSMRDFPSPHSGAQGTHPLCYMSLLLLLFVQAFFLSLSFFLGWGWSVQRAMLIWPRVVCGNTECHLAHLVF
jgi:hypothetical protein